MNLKTLATTATAAVSLISSAGDLYGFVHTMVDDVESNAKGTSGADKLAAVLEGARQYLIAHGKDIESSWDSIKTELTAFVNGVVATYNMLGIFNKAS